MPLLMVVQDGQARVQVVCDQCESRIQDAREGNYMFRTPRGTGVDSQQIVFTHKKCVDAFESVRGGIWGSLELTELPVKLAMNLAMPVEVSPDQGEVHYTLQGKFLWIN